MRVRPQGQHVSSCPHDAPGPMLLERVITASRCWPAHRRNAGRTIFREKLAGRGRIQHLFGQLAPSATRASAQAALATWPRTGPHIRSWPSSEQGNLSGRSCITPPDEDTPRLLASAWKLSPHCLYLTASRLRQSFRRRRRPRPCWTTKPGGRTVKE